MFLCIFLFVASYAITKTILHKVQNLPPSPFPTLPLIGHLHLLRTSLHRSLSKISHLHGPVLLLQLGSRRVLLVSSASAAEECLTKNDTTFANRPHLLAGSRIGYKETSLAWTQNSDLWRDIRRILSRNVLSASPLQSLLFIRAEEMKFMIRKMYHYGSQEVDMKALFFEFTLNVTMRIIAGKRYCRDDVLEFQEVVMETFRLGGASNIADFLPVLNWVTRTDKELIALDKRREKFLQDLVDDKRRTSDSNNNVVEDMKKTLIEVLLSLQNSQPEYYNDAVIKSIIAFVLIAGTDTSSGTMEWATSLMLNHPEVMKKAQKEIDNHIGHDRLIEESDFRNLPYLHCIINETMRMYPAGPLLIPHESARECTVGGYHIPSKTMLLINLWAMQNDPNTWEEPEKFRPERFEGLQGARDGFKFMPFGSGRRGCPGEGLAVRMVGLALGSLLQCFDWEKVDDAMVDMAEGTGVTLPKAQPLRSICRLRPAMAKLVSQI